MLQCELNLHFGNWNELDTKGQILHEFSYITYLH